MQPNRSIWISFIVRFLINIYTYIRTKNVQLLISGNVVKTRGGIHIITKKQKFNPLTLTSESRYTCFCVLVELTYGTELLTS